MLKGTALIASLRAVRNITVAHCNAAAMHLRNYSVLVLNYENTRAIWSNFSKNAPSEKAYLLVVLLVDTCLVIAFSEVDDAVGIWLLDVVLRRVVVDGLLGLLFSALLVGVLLALGMVVLLLLVPGLFLVTNLLIFLDILVFYIINFGAHLRGTRSGLTFGRAQTWTRQK